MTTVRPDVRFFALIPCAGSGSRAATAQPKQYESIAGQPMVMHTLAAFAAVPALAQTLVVVAADDGFFDPLPLTGCAVARCGGATRADSVHNGLQALLAGGAAPTDWVLVHDAARCLITPQQITGLMAACQGDAVGGLLAQPLADTLKSEAGGRVASTLDRAGKWLAQTPQMFRIGPLLAALDAAAQAQLTVTDESSAMEAAGHQPRLVPGSAQNFKVTWPEDFALAEAILRQRQHTPATHTRNQRSMTTPNFPQFRVGEGWDTHALVANRPLIIGGVTIPHPVGLLGHSDADVLLHAITDALLGAAALGDIGSHFPDTDARFKGADSSVLLAEVGRAVAAKGWRIGNIDATVIAQAPKLAPHIQGMRSCIAQALGLDVGQVNVKAKTAEKMGPVGEGLSMEARAVVLIF
ncbi:MAG: 2-C-methyl-D-erythritol 4-phosphate cytidylyltransferase [Polaromonas sp.]